ncbi:MAG: retroviral-like aspartic protease family protein [Sphingomonas sp.]|uniref:retropepsin-like aspartic protease n=1 Tax=Sphingomonas sp. TaxID=28214 RepID=UPI0025ED5158|nr:retropepsin-like aspartic protease [Sphingomonas sp.]MBY0285128.1 retroviral-like aspartic protease family protein [Sphingomonas sp.]
MPIDAPTQPTVIIKPATTPAPSVRGLHPIRLRPSLAGHFHMSGMIGGKPVEILIDTGASATVVDRSWAEANGFTLKQLERQGAGVGGATVALAMLEENRLTLDGLQITTPLVAIDLSNVKAGLARLNVAPPQVVLGVDVLRSRRAVIDYATSTLWLAPAPR